MSSGLRAGVRNSLTTGVPEVFLDLPDVHPVQQQMGGETVTERVDRHGLVDARFLSRCPDCLLDDRIADVMASYDAGSRIGGQRVAGEHPKPAKLASGVWVLAVQGVWQPHTGQPGASVGLMLSFRFSQLGAQFVASQFGEQG